MMDNTHNTGFVEGRISKIFMTPSVVLAVQWTGLGSDFVSILCDVVGEDLEGLSMIIFRGLDCVYDSRKHAFRSVGLPSKIFS